MITILPMMTLFKRLNHCFALALFLSALLASAQTASLLHAEIHSFHQHSAECDLLTQLGQPFQASGDASVVPLAHITARKITLPLVSAPALVVLLPYQGRAPPFSV